MKNKKNQRISIWYKLKTVVFKALLKKKHNTERLILKHNTIYILPSKMGAGFLLVTLLNFVLGINYQNNLILAMAYLMLVVMVLSLLMAYSNAKGLTVEYIKNISSYAPSSALLLLQIHTEKNCQALQIFYEGKLLSTIDEVTSEKCITHLDLGLNTRGEYSLNRLKFLSRYPFGLVSVWSYMQISLNVFVYPKQQKPEQDVAITNNQTLNDGNNKHLNGADEFDSLITHQVGMGMQRISWKHYAKTQQLMMKEFVSFSSDSQIFDFNQLKGSTEFRLQQLSFLISNAHDSGVPFGLQLASTHYSISQGKEHMQNCLQALSRFSNLTKAENEHNS
ncbi:DUF58 domain-containing protein [Pseudoalteromonas sp. NEC-BIFX-2020_002]|uniref:DUF58 domain-containing protein n=1 Tax=Pseudoalteromonas sp. NEC-BIFX-2020_002 TaxID=2732353 RepID=UPI0014771762|nr:DUF58 domain-containing protein [Pseudoalteromonas sp. NEC-BIFX-2020_002]NNG42996.1 DUF58 domain-containing protein [Pseudoalteromonas sp. NEC-BIFX-2020_002]